MNYRVGVAATIIILAVVLWTTWIAENDTETATDDFAPAEVKTDVEESLDSPREASTERTIDPENSERREDAGDVAGLFGRVSPTEIEGAIFQRIAEQSGLKLTSLNSVDCDARTCRVVFSGIDENPQHVGEYSDLLGALTNPPWNDFQPTSSSIGTREVSPGAREYVMGFTYVAFVDASADPEIAARQHAACAGAWARVTQQRGSDDYIRGAHERAAEWLEMSVNVLGLEEARRLADELRFGPLTRDCHAMPYAAID
jgi:hypothetical protein